MRYLRYLGSLFFFGAAALVPAGHAATLTVIADRDTTLIEDGTGLLANGSGPDLFVGRTAQPTGSIRRGLVHFDLSAIPKHAEIESVRLIVQAGSGNPSPRDLRVHRVSADWGEGASVSMGGGGVPSAPGDATWIHRFFDPALPAPPRPPTSAPSASALWHQPGGDFAPLASASTKVTGPARVVFENPMLTADVQAFVDHPKRNYGWIVLGDEGAPSTAKRLQSRQGMLLDSVPKLEIVYRNK